MNGRKARALRKANPKAEGYSELGRPASWGVLPKIKGTLNTDWKLLNNIIVKHTKADVNYKPKYRKINGVLMFRYAKGISRVR